MKDKAYPTQEDANIPYHDHPYFPDHFHADLGLTIMFRILLDHPALCLINLEELRKEFSDLFDCSLSRGTIHAALAHFKSVGLIDFHPLGPDDPPLLHKNHCMIFRLTDIGWHCMDKMHRRKREGG